MDIAIRRAARKLCMDSTIRRQSVPLNVLVNTFWYPLVAPNSDEEVIEIEAAQFNVPTSSEPLPMHPTTPEDCNGAQQFATYPNKYYLEPPSRIVIGPPKAVQQNVGNGMFVRCILQPTLTATTLDSSYMQFCSEYIASGALKHLLTMNKEEWYNPALAAQFDKDFNVGIGKARYKAETAYMQTDIYSAVHRW